MRSRSAIGDLQALVASMGVLGLLGLVGHTQQAHDAALLLMAGR